MKRVRLVPFVIAACVGIAVSAAAAPPENQTEAVFRQARQYTVRIRTRIETPLAGDEQGSFTGAGFLIDSKRGWIVTNAHVAGRGPSNIEVAFAGEAFEPARKLYVDSFADIAVLSLDHEVARPAARLAGPEPAPVGEAIGAYGHPLGIPFTGTRGIVSGQTDLLGPNLTQIDATVDHGNSGGPVIVLRTGEVMGIATLRAGDDQRDRLNFATPIADVHRIVSILRRGSSPRPPRLAFALLNDEDERTTMRVGETYDPRRWPFQPGDSIVAVPGVSSRIVSVDDLVGALRGRTDAIHLTVLRAATPVDVVVTPELRADLVAARGISIDGAHISPIEFDDQAAVTRRSTLLIQSVEPGSVASIRGLQSGDYVHEVDGRRFDSIDSLAAYVRSRSGHPLLVVVRRGTADPYRVFEHDLRELPGEDVKLIGPDGATTASN